MKPLPGYARRMTDVVRLGPAASATAAGHPGAWAGRAGHRPNGPGFGNVLAAILATPHAAASSGASPSGAGVHGVAFRVPQPVVVHDKRASAIPAQSDAALSQAMALEGVPQSWQSSLRFIMARESGGQVDAKNPVHSARGLFQLTAVNYHLNPNGARSFGNAVEEAQGGIRYIQRRYGTADRAVAFWQQHHWY